MSKARLTTLGLLAACAVNSIGPAQASAEEASFLVNGIETEKTEEVVSGGRNIAIESTMAKLPVDVTCTEGISAKGSIEAKGNLKVKSNSRVALFTRPIKGKRNILTNARLLNRSQRSSPVA